MRIIKIKEVLNMTGLGRSTMYELMAISQFPKSIPLGLRAVGWLESEIHQWMTDKINKRESPTGIRHRNSINRDQQ